MELLLILSALLSAVTGAFTGVRAPEPRAHHEASAQIAQADALEAALPARAARAAASVAVDALPGLLPEGAAFALALPAPLETIRLLE